ncbi:MAG: hypothetical protein HY865_24615 [Chloroflexi bacterium]|nr:hypothetical protein [Chloroflexota bacterium]
MSKLIALKSGTHEILSDAWFSDFSNLKQESLLFDQIQIYKLEKFYKALIETQSIVSKLYPNLSNKIDSIIMELEWLRQTGVVTELKMEEELHNQVIEEFERKAPSQMFEDAKKLLKKIIEIQTSDLINSEDEAERTSLKREQHFALLRLMSIVIETTKDVTAVTTIPYTEYSRELPNSRKSSVTQIAINKLPLPNNETPWEQIIDYRNDPENRKNLLSLRRWIRKISTECPSPAEIEEEIEWLMNEFQSHMNVHKMKANTEALEVIVKAPLELLELKFSKIAEPLFALKKRQINLMEAELNAPGKEMSYIIKTRDAFQPN